MGLIKLAAVLVVAGFSATVSAQGAEADLPVAKVSGVYVQLARGVLMEQRRAAKGFPGKRWADVDLGPGVPAERRRLVVELPDDVQAEAGDLVELRLEAARPPQLAGVRGADAPIALASRVMAVKARWFTDEAEKFGQPHAKVATLINPLSAQ